MTEHQQSTHEEYTLLDYQLNQNHHLHNLRERQEVVNTNTMEDSQSDYLLLDPNRTPMHTHAIDEEPTQSSDYLFLGREQDDHYQEVMTTTTVSPTSAPSMRGTKSFKINQEQETSNNQGKDRIRQVKPTTSQTHHYHTSIHTKTSHDNNKDLPLSPSDSTSTLQFYDLRAGLQIYGLSPENINDVEDVPEELVELHRKNAREKNGVNPEDLPEVWMAPPAPDSDGGSDSNNDGDDDEVELVQRAPDQDDDTTASSNTQACRSIQGKYGERTLKNPGVILRYQYELIQDTNDIDYTYTSNNGEEVRDGTEYLIENIVPSFEQGVGDVLVNALFEECGGGMRRKKKERRFLRLGTMKEHGLESWRELKSSTVVGLDGEPEDFPLGQGGECLLLVCWVDVVSIAFFSRDVD
eukprot:scaffold22815_cov61-Cyclotella_meneghiniana.AAC.10